MTALLLTPGTGVCKPAYRQRDTDRWRRQVTRLPRPIPQYPPLTLRYGKVRLLHCALVATHTSQQALRSARAFEYGSEHWRLCLRFLDAVSMQTVFASKTCTTAELDLHTESKQELALLFVKVQRGIILRPYTISRADLQLNFCYVVKHGKETIPFQLTIPQFPKNNIT